MTRAPSGDSTTRDAPPDPATLTANQLARRRAIVLAGVRLLEERPIDRIQVRDVADAAGVALATVYRYFASKEHLFAAVLGAWSETLSDHVRSGRLRGTTPEERLRFLMGRILRSFERWPQFFEVVTVLAVVPDRHAGADYQDYTDAITATWRDALRGIEPSVVEDIIRVIGPVLYQVVLARTRGTISAPDAREWMDRAITLIFGEPPRLLTESP